MKITINEDLFPVTFTSNATIKDGVVKLEVGHEWVYITLEELQLVVDAFRDEME